MGLNTIDVRGVIDNVLIGDGGNQTIQVYEQLSIMKDTKVIIEYKDKNGKEWTFPTTLLTGIGRPVVGTGEFKFELSTVIRKNLKYQEDQIHRWIKLKYALALKSVHHVKIYELLRAVENMPSWTVDYIRLKEMLGLKNEYAQFFHFKKWILETSKKSLRELTDISFEYEVDRGPRKTVKNIIFKVKKKAIVKDIKKDDLAQPSAVPEIFKTLARKEWKISEANSMKLIKEYGLEAVEEAVASIEKDEKLANLKWSGVLFNRLSDERDAKKLEDTDAKTLEDTNAIIERNRAWLGSDEGQEYMSDSAISGSRSDNYITIMKNKRASILKLADSDFISKLKTLLAD